MSDKREPPTGLLQMVGVRKSAELERGVEFGARSRTDYILAVINASDFTVREASTNGGVTFVATPAIPKNCNSDPETCFDSGNYTPFAVVPCGETVSLVLKSYRGGDRLTTTYEPVTTNCDYRGGVFILTNP
jgi:hypothetical protein